MSLNTVQGPTRTVLRKQGSPILAWLCCPAGESPAAVLVMESLASYQDLYLQEIWNHPRNRSYSVARNTAIYLNISNFIETHCISKDEQKAISYLQIYNISIKCTPVSSYCVYKGHM